MKKKKNTKNLNWIKPYETRKMVAVQFIEKNDDSSQFKKKMEIFLRFSCFSTQQLDKVRVFFFFQNKNNKIFTFILYSLFLQFSMQFRSMAERNAMVLWKSKNKTNKKNYLLNKTATSTWNVWKNCWTCLSFTVQWSLWMLFFISV